MVVADYPTFRTCRLQVPKVSLWCNEHQVQKSTSLSELAAEEIVRDAQRGLIAHGAYRVSNASTDDRSMLNQITPIVPSLIKHKLL